MAIFDIKAGERPLTEGEGASVAMKKLLKFYWAIAPHLIAQALVLALLMFLAAWGLSRGVRP